ncbi:UDP-glycosyltransferase 85A3 [Morella rubra]|uniref:UDP-glycosyltransferase 85A3 n=1 Tax=Morella rubra TaxID=262757 RepID=A0A6A1V2N4_9ROSI|nr:UDP-glycosyltransferase 85A3 [Morella rubra]KAB1206880.1 UDP-glycosyltransferase 85A3 [Morella rubra]
MKNILLKDLPSFVRTTDENDIMLNFLIHEAERSLRGLVFVLNTFGPFEQDVLDALSSLFPRIYTVGPLMLLVDQIKNDKLESVGSNLWKEEPSQTKDRDMFASWCLEEQILKHSSIGGFLTHSGWNSTSEVACGGVPMICWPFFAERHTNCRYFCTEWGIGMEIDNNVKRDEVEKLVGELMDGDKGKEMKKVMEWKIKAEEAAKPRGSSYQNLDKLIADVLLAGNV